MSADRDWITVNLNEVLWPALAPHGFGKRTDRQLGRVTSGIYQCISIYVSSRGSRQFRVYYSSVSLFHPRTTALPVLPGGIVGTCPPGRGWRRFFKPGRVDRWFPAATAPEASSSMESVAELCSLQAVPFFERTSSVEGLLECLRDQPWGSSHHQQFEIGCCLSRLGRVAEAQHSLAAARHEYEQDGRPWCLDAIAQVGALQAALATGNVAALLDDWEAASFETLALRRLLPPTRALRRKSEEGAPNKPAPGDAKLRRA